MRTCCAGFLKRHSPQSAWMLTKRRRSRTGRPMARGRNGAPKKIGNKQQCGQRQGYGNLCSSLLGCSLPRKRKTGLIAERWITKVCSWGSYPQTPALNATGRISSLQQKTLAPALWGILPWGPSLRQHPCWLGRVFCLRFGALERSFCAHHKRRLHRQKR